MKTINGIIIDIKVKIGMAIKFLHIRYSYDLQSIFKSTKTLNYSFDSSPTSIHPNDSIIILVKF